MSAINLSKAVRSNLLSLQSTAAQMAKTQERLATGNKVNSALDNPSNFFTAAGLNGRANDLGNLMDAMSTGIQTIEAANNGITAITKVVENMQSLVRQARADKTAAATTPGAAVVGANATPNSSTSTNNAMTFDVGGGVTVSVATYASGAARSISDIAADINNHSQLSGKVSAEVTAGGQLSLKNLTTTAIGVTGFAAADSVTGDATDTSTLAAGTGGGISDVRKSLMNQFNDLRGELDRLAQDAGINGINLLNGDALKLDFNENGTSSITIKGKDANGNDFGALDSTKLGITTQTDFATDSTLDTLGTTLQSALGTLRTQAAAYGSNLTTVQNRQDFTKAMINTLQTSAANLTLADTNEEAANLLALQTRQQLASTSLSMASQADQAVLRLF